MLNSGAGDGVLQSTSAASRLPPHQQALHRHRTSLYTAALFKLGVGDPGLTVAAYEAGVIRVETAMRENNVDHLTYLRDRDNKSFTQKHGDALANRVWAWCGAAADADLPEIHQLLAKSSIRSQIQALVSTSEVPLTLASAPLASTKLVDQVFRSLDPAGSGI